MWSLRAVLESAVKHGRRAFQDAQKRKVTFAQQQQQTLQPRAQEGRHKLSKWQSEGGAGVSSGAQATGSSGASTTSLVSSSVTSRLFPATSRLVQGFLRKVSSPLWSEAKRRTTKRLVFGESAPYFALVGVTLVSGSQQGFVTKEDELEALCCNIRDAISRAGWLHNPQYWEHHSRTPSEEEFFENEKDHSFTLADFKLGPAIDKGCNAVVYAAQWNIADEDEESTVPPLKRHRSVSPTSSSYNEDKLSQDEEYWSFEEDSASPNNDENQDKEISSVEVISIPIAELLEDVASNYDDEEQPEVVSRKSSSVKIDMQEVLSSGFSRPEKIKRVKFKVVESKDHTGGIKRPLRMESIDSNESFEDASEEATADHFEQSSIEKYPLAIKMMYNYDAESNAPAIFRAMHREMLPAKMLQLDESQMEVKERLCGNDIRLPSHPNIVEMPCVFVDRIPLLEDSMKLYPDALPSRLNPKGYGRNMSLFCVMKRYDTSLKDYLLNHEPQNHTSLLLLTQLLEAVLHINTFNVAHRDLKSDNVLLCLNEGWQYPLLVLTDFGCSLVAENSSMTVPFSSRDADPRQGNAALMAPEIKLAVPGLLRYVNYSNADLWAAGAIAYEMFGLENPFFPTHCSKGNHKWLESSSYKESMLPRLPKSVPSSIKHLIYDLLRRNPRNRPSPNIAATLCQLALWAPSKWLCRHALTLPSHAEITQWLLHLATKVLCEAHLSKHQGKGGGSSSRTNVADKHGSQLEYELVSTFLSRVHYMDIIQAIKWNRAF